MDEPRLKSAVWVQAYLRRAQAAGAFGTVARKGDPDAGVIIIKIFKSRSEVALFVRARNESGALVWRNPLAHALGESPLKSVFKDDTPIGEISGDASQDNVCHENDFCEERLVDEWIDKERAIDPDIWVVEIDDRQGRHFLSE